MITYDTNWMGPIYTQWFEERGLDYNWYGGRIDIRGTEDPYGMEYGLDVMDGQSWRKLTDWLDDFSSEELLTYDELINIFETENNFKINWYKEDEISRT